MHAFAEGHHEVPENRTGGTEEPGVCGTCGQTEDPPTEAIGEGIGIALDVAMLVERLERSRELALVAVEELGQPHHTESVAADIRVTEPFEHLETSNQSGRPGVHGCILPHHHAKMQLGLKVEPDSGMELPLAPDERRVCADIADRESELVDLVRELIRFDTTTHALGAEPRDEAALQDMLGRRLRAQGGEVRVWEPDPASIAGHPMMPDGFTFAGRPQLAACFRGTGGGRALLLNGHIDVIAAAPEDGWRHDPFAGVVEDGVVHGRGACDMKGGVASMVFAAETLARLGIELAGDLIVNTVSEEESTGAGGLAMARALRADAAIVPEPSSLGVWVACRGSLLPTITVEGRAGHAGLPPRAAEEGGAVNAIEKMALVLEAIVALRREWQQLPPHPFLSPADCVPTVVAGGEWIVSYPAACRLDCHIEYLPGQADEHGWGSLVEQEFSDWILQATAADPWLAAHPPQIEWLVGGVPPAEVPLDDPIVSTALGAARAVGRASELGGLENWHDGATLIVEAGIPSICLGPGDINVAHTVDEFVPVVDLVACAQAIAVTAMRYCR